MMNAGVVVNGGAMLNNNGNEEGERKKKKKKKKKKKIEKEHEEEEESLVLVLPYLDENICTEILIRVPVESLFNSFRYVCKSWLNIITNHPSNFPLKRLRSKPPCLIIQLVKCLRYSNEVLYKEEELEEEEEKEGDYTCTTSFIKMGKQGIEKQFDITPILKKLRIRACCNGLILVSSKFKRISTLYVVNPLTNHQVMLPPHPLESNPRYALYCWGTIKFVFIPSTGEYRVIMGGFCPGNEILQPKHYIQILTLSAEECCSSSSSSNDDCHLPRREWRIIEVPEQQSMRRFGILQCVWGLHKHIKFEFDVDTGKFYEFRCPVYHGHQEKVSGFMEMGGFITSWALGLLHRYDDALTLSVHVLKDFHTEEWIHQYSVRIDPDFLNPKHDFGHTPVLSSGSDEVIIFRNNIHKTLWAYNVESHQRWEVGTNLIEWDEDICFYDFHVNKNVTLESLYSN